MNKKYASVICSEEYWKEAVLKDLSPQACKNIIWILLEKIDALNERVYEAAVRAEDAYQEVERLRAEYRLQLEKQKKE